MSVRPILHGLVRAVAGGMLVGLVACGPTASPPPAPQTAAPPERGDGARPPENEQLRALIEGARREGQLSFVWGDGTIGGTDGIRRLAVGFNQLYGLNLDVKYTPGPSMAAMSAKTVEEYQAGRTASTDIMVGYANNIVPIAAHDGLEAVDWASWAPNIQDPRQVAPGGTAVAIASSTPGIAYNASRISGSLVPRTLEDLLKPEYKGRVASTPYAASFDQLAVAEAWGEQRTTQYVTRLADQIAGLIRCNEMERLVSGEFDVLAIVCSQANPVEAKARGAPLAFVIPADGPIMKPLYMAVPKSAAHPNAAKLWINYLLSREAQDLMYELDYQDSHLVPGSKMGPEIERLQASGVKFIQADMDFYYRNDEREMSRMLNDFVRILTK